jgi:hypothetical protein
MTRGMIARSIDSSDAHSKYPFETPSLTTFALGLYRITITLIELHTYPNRLGLPFSK